MRAKITYPGAYHHVMSRGIRGVNIFPDEEMKTDFLKILKSKSSLHYIKILSFCVMDNHYHLVLEDAAGKLSNFMKNLNGHFGKTYRGKKGGSGHVFQGRYKSILIQNDTYLKMAIAYSLLNPLRAGLVKSPDDYKWSSFGEYFSKTPSDIVDSEFVEKLYQSEGNLLEFLSDWAGKELEVKQNRYGRFLGDDDFIKESIEIFDRRKGKGETERKRKEDYIVKTGAEVISSFEKELGRSIDTIKVYTREGKKLRNKLLVLLRDVAGLKYSEIIKYKPFRNLKYSSLGKVYQRAKEEMENEDERE